MIALDMQTIIFANVIINAVGILVMLLLYLQNRDKYSGLELWVLDWVLLTGGTLLITSQGSVPDWESIILSNSMIVGGTICLYFGLRQFAGLKSSRKLILGAASLFVVFAAAHTFFTYIHPALLGRIYNATAALLLASIAGLWLMFKEVGHNIRRLSTATGIAFGVIAVICIIRILGFALTPQSADEFLQSGRFDELMVMILVSATTFLVYTLVLMLNRRLYFEAEDMENALNRNVRKLQAIFMGTSVGFGILSDRVFKEVNDGLCQLLGYMREEMTGKEARFIYPSEIEYRNVGNVYETIAVTGAVTIETVLLRKDGVKINVIMNISAFDQTDISLGVVISVVDITERKVTEHILEARVKELRAFYLLSEIIERKNLTQAEVYQEITGFLPGSWQYPEIACARITVGKDVFQSANFRQSPWLLTALIRVNGNTAGNIVVGYLAERPAADEGPFLKEERGLIDAVAERLGRIIERHQMAKRLNEVNNILRLISSINQLIVAKENEAELLNEACRRFIESRQYTLAWIGFKQHGTYDIRPSAWAGESADYLSSIRVTWDNSEFGRGPTGTALKTGKPVVMSDIPHNADYAPWRDYAARMGFVSSASLPLIIRGEVVGVLNIYSVSAESFDAKEMELLAELSDDLALGIEKIRNRNEQQRIEDALRLSELNFRTFMDNSSMGIRISDENNHTLFSNKALMEIFGYADVDELEAFPPSDLYSPESRIGFLQRQQLMLQGKVMPEYVELEIFRKDGTTRYLQTFHKEMLWDGKLRYQTLYNDISARKRAEEALQASEEKYRLIVENTLDIIFTTNIREEYIYVSPSVKNILGYEPAELIGRLFISLVHPDDLPGLQEEIQRSYGNNYRISEDREYRLRHASGEWRWVVSRGARVMDANDQFINFTGVISDITKRKAAEESLKASLAEKETLLKEVHHRVKNNMQVISSLLHLQEGRTKDKESQTVLKDSQNRIQSMALVYNKLYQSKNLANIPMTDYITELTGGLVKSYAARSSRVAVNVIPGDVSLSVDLAIPCGLVINELVTNAMKYAFPENRKGIINISLKEGNQENLVLTVVDDGVGIPADFDLVNTHTLGLKLVNSLVTDQLGGTIELDRTHGTAFKIVFPGSKEAKYGEVEDSGSGG